MIKIKCIYCKRFFKAFLCHIKIGKKYCSNKCKNLNRRGKKNTPESKQKLRDTWNNPGFRKHMSKVHTGKLKEKSSHWNGGKVTLKTGYILIYSPDHPRSIFSKRYVFEHILVVEKSLGRYLKKGETIHHLSNKNDNRRHKLMAFVSHSAHMRFHNNPANVKPEEIIFDGRNTH